MYQDERKLDFKPLGIAIKKAREAKGWTQEYLAQLVDLTPRSIMYIENRGQHPRLNKFYLITTLLDISVDQFFFPCNEDGDNNRRKQVDVLLNDMEEKELRAAFSTEQSRSHRRQEHRSTRLNSSHVSSSYAVFCLKKKYLRQVIFIISIPPIHSIL